MERRSGGQSNGFIFLVNITKLDFLILNFIFHFTHHLDITSRALKDGKERFERAVEKTPRRQQGGIVREQQGKRVAVLRREVVDIDEKEERR